MTFPIPVVVEEPPVDYPQADGSIWRRTGSCSRCGECCRSGDPFTDNQGEAQPCRYLQGVDGGEHSCANWDGSANSDHYPYVVNSCRAWPSAPEHVTPYPSCTYVFVRIA